MKCLKTITICFIISVCLGLAQGSSAEVTGKASVGAGYLAHPLGIAEETEAGYLYQVLQIASVSKSGGNAFKAGYEGQASQFGNETHLGSQRHGMGLEFFSNSADRKKGFSAGVQASMRRHDDWYQVYDHNEAYGYLALKKFLDSRHLFKGYAGFRARKYDELPEESYIEPHAQLEIQRFSENRTSLGLRVRYGWKQFNDDVASQVWETLNLPSTSQLAARLSFSKGLSDRVGLRSWGEYRFKLSEFPYYVADDIYDSPVLDRYATEGYDVFVAVKTLAPHQWWVEGGASLGHHDYGEIQFATLDGQGQIREETVTEAYVSLQRTLGKNLGQPRFNLMAGWRNQDSTHDWYNYSGFFGSTNLSWKF